MKILIVNEFIKLGGAEQITQEQVRIFKNKGHEVYELYFNKGKYELEIGERQYLIQVSGLVKKNIFCKNVYKKITRLLETIKPDVILANNIWSSPYSQYKAFSKYKVIQVVHDFYPVCPNTLCVKFKNNNEVCLGYKYNKCLKYCVENNSKIQLFVKRINMKKLEKVRKKYVDLFVTPSEKLNTYMLNYGYKSVCINNPIGNNTKKELDFSIKHNKTLEYIYVGGINNHKGVLELIDAFIDFSRDKDVVLNIYGSITELNIQSAFYSQINKVPNKIIYHGPKAHDLILKYISESNFLVIPSKWMENYPTVVLESMINGTVVIGSNIGGITEMLSDDKGILFDVRKKETIIDALNRSYTMDEKEYISVCSKSYQYVVDNNSTEGYYIKLLREMEKLQ